MQLQGDAATWADEFGGVSPAADNWADQFAQQMVPDEEVRCYPYVVHSSQNLDSPGPHLLLPTEATPPPFAS